MIFTLTGALGRVPCGLNLLLEPFAFADVRRDSTQGLNRAIRIANGELVVQQGPRFPEGLTRFLEHHRGTRLEHLAIVLYEGARMFRRKEIPVCFTNDFGSLFADD